MMRLLIAFFVIAASLFSQIPLKLQQLGAKPKKSAASSSKSTPAGQTPESAKPNRAPPKPAVSAAGMDPDLGLKFSALSPIRYPPMESYLEKNGIKVWLAENHELPLVSGLILFHGGSVLEPAEKAGLAEYSMRALVAGGTASLPGPAFLEKLDRLGVNFQASAEAYSCQISFRCPSDRLAEVLEMVGELLTHPAFDPSALEEAQGTMRTRVGQRNRDPRRVANREFLALVHGTGSPATDHPAYRKVEYETLDNLGPEDAAAFLDGKLSSRAAIALSGDFSASAVRSPIDKISAAWKSQLGAPGFPKIEETPFTGVFYVERRDLKQTAFVAGQSGTRADDPDAASLTVMAEILGGKAGSRLYDQELASPEWAASFATAWEPGYFYPGTFRCFGVVLQPYTVKAIRYVIAQLEEFREGKFTEKEVESAKLRVIYDMAKTLGQPMALLKMRILDEMAGLPASHLADFQAAIASVKKSDVARAAKSHIDPQKFTIAVVGSETLFDQPLAELGQKVSPLDIEIPGPRSFAQKTDPASLERGKALLNRMRDALGGAAKLGSIRDFSLKAEGTEHTIGTNSVKLAERWIADRTWRQDLHIGNVLQTLYYDGSLGWLARGSRVMPLPKPAVTIIRGEIFRILYRLALSDLDKTRTVCHLGANILQVAGMEGEAVRIYIDEKSGLPARMHFLSQSLDGLSVTMEEAFSDWRETNGIRWPGRIVTKQNGRRYSDLRYAEMSFNGGLRATDLQLKP